MTNKQQLTKEEDNDYPLSREDFLEPYIKLEEAVRVIQNINVRSQEQYTLRSIDPDTHKPYSERRSIAEVYSAFEPTVYQKHKERFIDTVTNRDGTFRTLSNLISSGTITDDEVKFFPQEKLPRREIVQLHRVKALDGQQYILRHENWIGITASGAIVNESITLGRYTEPHYETKMVPRDESLGLHEQNKDGPTVRVAVLSPPMGEYSGTTKYIEKYTPERIRFYLKHMRKGTRDRDWSVSFVKEGERHSLGFKGKELEPFISGDFDKVWEEGNKVKPAVDLDELSKKFTEAISKKAEKEVEDAEHYQ